MQKHKDDTHPWVLCVGTSAENFSSAVCICNRKVITVDIGKLVVSALLVLLGIHYTYSFSYNPLTQQVLEFLQEKLLGDQLPPDKKITSAYSNLFRAVDCIEEKMLSREQHILDEVEQEMDHSIDDNTQAVCEFDT